MPAPKRRHRSTVMAEHSSCTLSGVSVATARADAVAEYTSFKSTLERIVFGKTVPGGNQVCLIILGHC